MKYELILRCRPNPSENVKERHIAFLEVLKKLDENWAVTGLPSAEEPVPGGSESFSLKNHTPKSLTGDLRYSSRETLRNHGSSDDYLVFEFDTSYKGCKQLDLQFFKKLIESLSPYYMYLGDYEFTFIDKAKVRKMNLRESIHRFYPVTYFDKELCISAFNLTPNEFISHIANEIDGFSIVNDGVLFMWNELFVPLEDAEKMNSLIWSKIKTRSI